jgi:hypothetical protein
MTENRGRCDRTTTAGVRLDEGKPPSSSLACPSVSPFWLSPGRLRPNFVAAEPPGTEDHLQPDGNPKNVGLNPKGPQSRTGLAGSSNL